MFNCAEATGELIILATLHDYILLYNIYNLYNSLAVIRPSHYRTTKEMLGRERERTPESKTQTKD